MPRGRPSPCPQATTAHSSLLATGVNGSQPNQTFTVTYTDGTTQTFTQSISDWAEPVGYAGESTAISTSYRDTVERVEAVPARITSTSIRSCSTPPRRSQSITLPKDSHVEVLAIDVQP